MLFKPRAEGLRAKGGGVDKLPIPNNSARPSCLRFLRNLLSGPAGRALALSVLLYFLAYQYCNFNFWRDPHSAFFDDTHVYDLHYSDVRRREAQGLIHAANSGENIPESVEGIEPKICAVIPTFERDGSPYLPVTVGSLLHGLTPEERSSLYLIVFFAHTDPSVHKSWSRPWIHSRLVDAVVTYNVSSADRGALAEQEENHDYLTKAVFDYSYSLQLCNKTGAPYVGVFEDDLIFADGWMSKTLNALHELRWRQHLFYLRLFFTETYLSWTVRDFWYRNMPYAFFLAMFSTYVALVVIRWRHPGMRKHLDNYAVAIICLLTVPAFTLLVYMIGKYSLMPLRGIVEMKDYSSGTQALIYPQAKASKLSGYLKDIGTGELDQLVEEFAKENGYKKFAYAPQQAQHVGLRSSKDTLELHTKKIWAFHFEENSAARLKAEHYQNAAMGIAWTDNSNIDNSKHG